jgi:uncharacterized membrane protein
VRGADAYCGVCGARQPVAAPGAAIPDYMTGMSSRTASMLCYVPWLGWLAAIVVLASARFRNDTRVRFNAFQGIYLFVAWLIVDRVVSPMLRFGFGFPHFGFFNPYRSMPALLNIAIFAAWVFMIIKASQEELFRLPILGDLADKSVTEQR